MEQIKKCSAVEDLHSISVTKYDFSLQIIEACTMNHPDKILLYHIINVFENEKDPSQLNLHKKWKEIDIQNITPTKDTIEKLKLLYS